MNRYHPILSSYTEWKIVRWKKDLIALIILFSKEDEKLYLMEDRISLFFITPKHIFHSSRCVFCYDDGRKRSERKFSRVCWCLIFDKEVKSFLHKVYWEICQVFLLFPWRLFHVFFSYNWIIYRQNIELFFCLNNLIFNI